MKLPKIDTPVFEIKLASLDKPVKFRPFTVKEEKILLIADESAEDRDVLNAIKQVINNCCIDNIDIGKLPLFDIEYFFLQLRAKSVSNISVLKYRDNNDNMIRDFDVDLDEIKPTIDPNHSNIVKLTDNITVEFKYPSIDSLLSIKADEELSDIEYLAQCIDNVYEGEEVYPGDNFSHDEKVEFINDLSTKMLETIMEKFINTMPKLTHTIEYVNEKGEDRKIVLEGYRSFFQ